MLELERNHQEYFQASIFPRHLRPDLISDLHHISVLSIFKINIVDLQYCISFKCTYLFYLSISFKLQITNILIYLFYINIINILYTLIESFEFFSFSAVYVFVHIYQIFIKHFLCGNF